MAQATESRVGKVFPAGLSVEGKEEGVRHENGETVERVKTFGNFRKLGRGKRGRRGGRVGLGGGGAGGGGPWSGWLDGCGGGEAKARDAG